MSAAAASGSSSSSKRKSLLPLSPNSRDSASLISGSKASSCSRICGGLLAASLDLEEDLREELVVELCFSSEFESSSFAAEIAFFEARRPLLWCFFFFGRPAASELEPDRCSSSTSTSSY